MDSLSNIFKRIGHFGSDAGHNDKDSTHSYITHAYEKLLAPFRERCDFLEIGLAQGMSMKLWGAYFGPQCRITGIDLSLTFDTSKFDHRFTFITGDATKPEIVEKLGGRAFDVCCDDGSHAEADQIATFNLLKSRMKPGGLYCIEDIIDPASALPRLTQLHSPHEVYDLRKVKGRFDDVLVVFRF